jgi:hypothetical protein
VTDKTGQTTMSVSWSGGVPRKLGVFARGALLALALSTGACRTDKDDVQRWATTVQGPKKLIAVLTHGKYPLDLRVEAALALVSMKPRNGRRVGIDGSDEHPGLITSLGRLPPTARTAIIERLVPALEAQVKLPPPIVQGGQVAPDPSVPYKDAAFALLTHERGRLVTDAALRQRLRNALAQWISTGFAQRYDDSSQTYAVKQMVTELRVDAVKALPAQMVPGASKVDAMAELISDFGDAPTKLAASERLVVIATETASPNWIRQKSPGVEAANKASKLAPTPEQFAAQMQQYQEEELLRIFASMKRIAGAPVVDYLLRFVQDKSRSPKLRSGALAALQGHVDRTSAAHAEAVLAVAAAADTPDQVRDVALLRVGEFPRAIVIERLYGLFANDNWKVRWVAAELVLKMSDTSQLRDFFERIGRVDGMAITEPLRYGALIAEMKGPQKPFDVVSSYLGSNHPVEARATALGYFYNKGTAADLPKLTSLTKDPQKTPTCEKDAQDCEWKCEVAADGKRETKDISTLGEFVEFCVKPAVEKRGTP